jgi:serine/threonine protein kinase
LHSKRIIHRDLKAENILIHNGIFKIADFGFSKQLTEEEANGTLLGTITTMAPEVMKREKYGLKVVVE